MSKLSEKEQKRIDKINQVDEEELRFATSVREVLPPLWGEKKEKKIEVRVYPMEPPK
ncbi:MAG TPA: hypothetical protein P5230_02940 [Candidatus Magasanikbacteria bacterium]|nr:hypothetical protein [Candidatus Magasanikbacteria bacterium]